MIREFEGKIIKGLGGLYDVYLRDGDAARIISCRAKKALHRHDEKLLIGDRVTVTVDDSVADATVISACAKRRNALIRPPMANLDVLFVVFAACQPEPVFETVDKLIAIAEYHAITPVILVTKSDLDAEKAAAYSSLYRRAGFDTFAVSSHTRDGVGEIAAYIRTHIRDGKTAAFAGASGVGKSSLLNALFPGMTLATGAISRKIERGKHTTRAVELFSLGSDVDCGFLADTPGFSLIDFEHFDFFGLDDLFATFRDFRPFLGKCRYSDCAHCGEGIDECAIARAANDGEIAQSRLDSYRAIYTVLKNKNRYE